MGLGTSFPLTLCLTKLTDWVLCGGRDQTLLMFLKQLYWIQTLGNVK